MQKTSKSLFAVLLSIALIISIIPLSAFAADEVWDGRFPSSNSKAKYSGGSGTKNDPYLIATAADLAQLSVNTRDIINYSFGKFFYRRRTFISIVRMFSHMTKTALFRV